VLKYGLLGVEFLVLLSHFNFHLLVQVILQNKTPKIVVQKSSHLNNTSINMVVVVVTRNHVVVEEQVFKECEILKARPLVD
jgi:hypothetical protein